MNDNSHDHTVEKNVLDAITRGDVKMRPRWYFMLRSILAAAIGILFAALLIGFASMAIFVLHQNGVWFAPNFGILGWILFFRSLPAILILSVLVCAAAVAVLAWQYSFVYHRPLVYVLLVIATLTTAASFLIVPTSFHREVMSFAEEKHLPFIDAFYEFEEGTPNSVHRGTVVAVTNDGFVLQNLDGTTSSIVLIATTTSFGVSDTVVVFGDENASGTIHPFGVEEIPPF